MTIPFTIGTTASIACNPRDDDKTLLPDGAVAELIFNLSGIPKETEQILVVEDEEMVRHVTREILETSGYRVLTAANGEEAYDLCKEYAGPIGLMITDVVMPEMGGRELAERSSQLRPEMMVLYMSGYTDDAIVGHGVLDEHMPFLRKPFTPEALCRKVRELLRQHNKHPLLV
jgi:two-component system cell cycle sensor histidine kinase/response regulator CckA